MVTSRLAPLRVGLLGHGAIGRPIAEALRAGRVAGAELTAVFTNSGTACRESTDFDQLVSVSDVVVEAAGHEAVRAYASRVLGAGVDLVLLSVGALADVTLRETLPYCGAGRLLISSGAIGGLDVLRAARNSGPVTIRLTSTKTPAGLVQCWMGAEEVADLHAAAAARPVVVFEGSVAEAASRFPANTNVAATLALAAGDWDAVTVTLVADAFTTTTHHDIAVETTTGSYRLSIRNVPSPCNPASSGLVANAVLRALEDRAADSGPVFS